MSYVEGIFLKRDIRDDYLTYMQLRKVAEQIEVTYVVKKTSK